MNEFAACLIRTGNFVYLSCPFKFHCQPIWIDRLRAHHSDLLLLDLHPQVMFVETFIIFHSICCFSNPKELLRWGCFMIQESSPLNFTLQASEFIDYTVLPL